MSDKGDKTCPLCAEEMDFTDQQLKPCKCGYDICVWCWHHIMDMAEKDGNEGRCPACRVPYDKEKIVGMAANCGRVVSEINTERKVKSQKGRAKPSEGRKHLSSVRVVQRNLVYVVGLPLNLGDEDLLQHKEYFGRYGKVLKVSLSRTSTGLIQQFPNNTCSVYITYSKEEEATRCIQAVHGFTLEGRPLRACFGTTKYCHAWLRNMPCSNPDCLYLHETGSQEDSFTKDEVVPAHTRVQEITGATTNLQCRSGNVLPPPLNENAGNSTALPGKSVPNNATNLYPSLPSSANPIRVSPPHSSSVRPATLPSGASWGVRASSSQPSMTSSETHDTLGNLMENTTSVPVAFSSAVASTVRTRELLGDLRKKLTSTEGNHYSPAKEKQDSSRKKQDGLDSIISSLYQNNASVCTFPEVHQPATGISTHQMEDVTLKKSYGQAPEKSAWDDDDDIDANLYTSKKTTGSGLLSISDVHYSEDRVFDVLSKDLDKSRSHGGHLGEIVTSEGQKQFTSSESTAAEKQYDRTSTMTSQVSLTEYSDVDDDVRSFNIQRLEDSQIVTRPSHLLNLVTPLSASCYESEPSIHVTDGLGSVHLSDDPSFGGVNLHGSQLDSSRASVMSSGYNVNSEVRNGSLFTISEENQIRRSEDHVDNGLFNATGLRENIIISDILSMDFESDASLAARNLARLFSDVEKQQGSYWNAQGKSSQSRFSFAREEESSHQPYAESSNPNLGHHFFSHSNVEGRNQYVDKIGHNSSVGFDNFEEYNTARRNQAAISSNKLPASRVSPVSAPPGFSIPNRTVPLPPPPGFTTDERVDQILNTHPGNSPNQSLFRSLSQAPPTENMFNNGDIEFIDPAILAVGKGRVLVGGNNDSIFETRSNFPSEFLAYENEARLKLLMQRSLTSQNSMQSGFSYLSETHGLYPPHVEQSQGSSYSPFAQVPQLQHPRNGMLSNGQRHDGWSILDSQFANNLNVSDPLVNERVVFNQRYNGFQDAAFQMPNSTTLYSKSFGI